MFIEFLVLGLAVGFMSGLFGIGGGAILVPSLMLFGLCMKSAIGVSVMQMMFSSIYGSFLNQKRGTFVVKEGIFLGLGGFVGAQGSGFLVNYFSAETLKFVFLISICLAIYKTFATHKVSSEPRTSSNLVLFVLGFCTGLIAISIGIGGGIFIVPFLIGLMNYDIKRAVALGLFFVVFSSISGFISLSLFGYIDYRAGFLVGISSLVGVFFGVRYAHVVDKKRHKKLLLGIYCIILVLIVNKLYF